MSAAEQLTLGVVAKTKKLSAAQTFCKCGHDIREHANGKASCTYGAHVGAPCDCKKFRGRARKPVPVAPALAAPSGAITLWRPDTVRRKAMGWALASERYLGVYLEQLKTERPNVMHRWSGATLSPAMQQRMHAAFANKCKAQCERAMSAIEQAQLVRDLGRPRAVTITRVSTGKLDDDAVVGALKWIRDGVAEALLFDDRLFSIEGVSAAGVPIFYRQAAPGKRGVFGVQIEIQW